MDIYEQLRHVGVAEPWRFDPDNEVNIFDTEDEEWKTLAEHGSEVEAVVSALRHDELSKRHVRITDETAIDYLTYHAQETFHPAVHDCEELSREGLVTLADEGRTNIDDLPEAITANLLGDSDTTALKTLVTEQMQGFTSGRSSRADTRDSSGPLANLDPRDDFDGWDLTSTTGTLIEWHSNGGFRVSLKPTMEGNATVAAEETAGKDATEYRLRGVEVTRQDRLSPQNALVEAEGWLTDNQLRFEDDLTTVIGVGPVVQDYLALEHGVNSLSALRQLAHDDPEAFGVALRSHADEARENLGLSPSPGDSASGRADND